MPPSAATRGSDAMDVDVDMKEEDAKPDLQNGDDAKDEEQEEDVEYEDSEPDMDVTEILDERLQFVVFAVHHSSCPELLKVPSHVDRSDVAAFHGSLEENPIKAAMEWETRLLAKYPIPFFQVRVGDVRASLNSPSTALDLYMKAQEGLGVGRDPVYDDWLNGYKRDIDEQVEVEEEMDLAEELTTDEKNIVQPYKFCKNHPRPAVMRMISLKDTTETVNPMWGPNGMTDAMWDRYLNAYCIETCQLDDAFQLVPQSARKLARDGLSPQFVDTTSVSRTKNPAHIVAMIKDFKKAYSLTQEYSKDYEKYLTVGHIKALHAQVMASSRYLPHLADHQNDQIDPRKWKYVNLGCSRTESRKTLVLAIINGIQKTCPFRQVDSELEYMCWQGKQWIKNFSAQNPISISCWMFLLTSRTCPFEEGNMRMASLISAIPLLRQQIPPILVPKSLKKEYADVQTKAYEGNPGPLGDLVLKSLRISIEEVVNM